MSCSPEGPVAEQCAAAATEQVRRDRGHPSIILWSAMNELGEARPVHPRRSGLRGIRPAALRRGARRRPHPPGHRERLDGAGPGARVPQPAPDRALVRAAQLPVPGRAARQGHALGGYRPPAAAQRVRRLGPAGPQRRRRAALLAVRGRLRALDRVDALAGAASPTSSWARSATRASRTGFRSSSSGRFQASPAGA